jgi:hypothetical protein
VLDAIIQPELELGLRSCESFLGVGDMLLGAGKLGHYKPSGFVVLALLMLAGCGTMGEKTGAANNSVAPPSRILDPIAAFAADPPANAQAQVFLAEGNESATLRIARQYSAASGRECREVRVTKRGGDSLRLYCRAGAGWIEARPLIAETVGR